MVTVRPRSASLTSVRAANSTCQPSSHLAWSCLRDTARARNSESRSRHGFSPSEVRKSVKRGLQVAGQVPDDGDDRVAAARDLRELGACELADRAFAEGLVAAVFGFDGGDQVAHVEPRSGGFQRSIGLAMPLGQKGIVIFRPSPADA